MLESKEPRSQRQRSKHGDEAEGPEMGKSDLGTFQSSPQGTPPGSHRETQGVEPRLSSHRGTDRGDTGNLRPLHLAGGGTGASPGLFRHSRHCLRGNHRSKLVDGQKTDGRFPGEARRKTDGMTPTERHWDYICLTVLTIETAALAAAFLIPGTDENASRTTRLTESLSAVLK